MINVGIIGAGRIGQVHARSILTGVPQAHILAIADPYMKPAVAEWAKASGIENVYTDYKKILEEKHPEAAPLLAFAQWTSGSISAAKETLEFNPPSRTGMVVRTLIAIAERDEETAMRSAQQSAGASIPPEWIGFNLELERLKKMPELPAAVKVLLKSIRYQGR